MFWIFMLTLVKEPALEKPESPEAPRVEESREVIIEKTEEVESEAPKRPFLGVYGEGGELTPLLKEHLGIDHGWVLGTVVKDGPAEKAGLKAHDIVLTIDGRKVLSFTDIQEAVRARKPGDRIVLEILRAGKSQSVEVTLGEAAGASKEVRILRLEPELSEDSPESKGERYELKLKEFRNRHNLDLIPEALDGELGRLREMLKRHEEDMERHARELEKYSPDRGDSLQDEMKRFREEIERAFGEKGLPGHELKIIPPHFRKYKLQVPEGAEGKSFSTRMFVDSSDEGTVTVAEVNGQVKISVQDAEGKVLLNEGTPEEAEKLPEPWLSKVKTLLARLK